MTRRRPTVSPWHVMLLFLGLGGLTTVLPSVEAHDTPECPAADCPPVEPCPACDRCPQCLCEDDTPPGALALQTHAVQRALDAIQAVEALGPLPPTLDTDRDSP